MKLSLVLLIAMLALCGCKPPEPRTVKYDQKMETYGFIDAKAMQPLLDVETALGWEVSASAFDSKSGTLVVFFKKPR